MLRRQYLCIVFFRTAMRQPHQQRGFTLIELLTVIGILGVLASLAITSFSMYRANAAYSVVQRTLQDARAGVESSLTNPDSLPPAVAVVNQQAPGALADASARTFLPATQIPRNISFTVSFDPGCQGGGCQSAFLEARHLYGKRYQQWVRFGDGLYVPVEVAGDGW